MNIIHRIVTASEELVFESPWGNKVHLQLCDDQWTQRKGNKYWIEISPSLDIKVKMDSNNNWMSGGDDSFLDRFRDPDQTYTMSSIRAVLWNRNIPKLPWVPCKEDQSLVHGYLVECFDRFPRYYDTYLLRKYLSQDPGELVTPFHPLVTEIRQNMHGAVMVYDAAENSLYDFLSSVKDLQVPELMRRYGLGEQKDLPLNVAKYILSKAK